MSGGAPVPVGHAGARDAKILCIDDLEKEGSKRMDPVVRDFYNSGSTHQTTLHSNTSAYQKYRLRPRVLVDVSKTTTTTPCFSPYSPPISFPICVSPAGIQAMAHPDGEIATSKACAKFGVNMAASSFANYPVADIVNAGKEVNPGMQFAMQMYTMKDRPLQRRMLQRAEAAGCSAIFLTADSPVLGVRYNEWRSDFRTPAGLAFPNLELTSEDIRAKTHDDGFQAFNDDSHSWSRDIPWLRENTKMQIWIKGVLTAEDAEECLRWGVDGILVSNHGGRQLDGVPASVDALVEVIEVIEGRIPVHVDGGIRTGQDVFVALALGADVVWVGRPALWGLAYDGQRGVELMLQTLRDEFKRCMQLTGCTSVKDITRDRLARVTADGLLVRLPHKLNLKSKM